HSEDEARQFVELTSRLIDQVDDATRAAVRARLAVYPGTPVQVRKQLGLKPSHPDQRVPLAREIPESSIPESSIPGSSIVANSIPASPSAEPQARAPSQAQSRMATNLSMQPTDAAEISGLFFSAGASE